MKKYIIYLGMSLNNIYTNKTANCLLQFIPEKVYGFIAFDDTLREELRKNYKNMYIFDFQNLDEIKNNMEIVIGFAPVGGKLGTFDVELLSKLSEKGIKVINTLHTKIDLKNFVNYRLNDVENEIATGNITHRGKRILFIGTDFSIGKMTATVSLYNEMKRYKYDVEWVATGQTGKLIKDGNGIVLDSCVIDYMPGILEKYINNYTSEYLLIEGQGSIFHPSYAPTSFGLFFTVKPQYLILCHNPSMNTGHLGNKMPTLKEAIEFYENLAKMLGFESRVISIALNTNELSVEEYKNTKNIIEKETNLSCCDVFKDNPIYLIENILNKGEYYEYKNM